VLHRVFQAIADGVELEAASALVREEAALAEAVGPVMSAMLRVLAVEDWQAETGLCPWCGEPEPAP
jgi:hypothetical protein